MQKQLSLKKYLFNETLYLVAIGYTSIYSFASSPNSDKKLFNCLLLVL